MVIAELREAVALLVRMPLLFIPGVIGGGFAAIIWLTLFVSGSFFTSRLLVIFSLVLLFFITGMYAVIRDNKGTVRNLVIGGVNNYFRVLLPQLVIGFVLLLVFMLCMIVFALLGLSSDIALLTALTFGIMIPTLVLTFFFDTAAVFEDRRVFASIQRSVLLVSEHMKEVLSFFLISALVCAGVVFALMIIWEVLLFDKLKPVMDFTDTQREAFSPDQLITMIGPDGIWVTAGVVFISILILLPLLFTYKACFYKKIAAGPVKIEQQIYGEYDSKGRWYKY